MSTNDGNNFGQKVARDNLEQMITYSNSKLDEDEILPGTQVIDITA